VSTLATQPVVLASASAARATLLEHAGLSVVRDPAAIDEAMMKADCRRRGTDAASCAEALAAAKATEVSRRHPAALVIGADQMLICATGWLDKPRSRAEAREQLLELRDARHELVTAVCVVRDGAVQWSTLSCAFLFMRDFSEAFLDAYLDAIGDDVLTTVGGYRLEGLGVQLFARVEGDYFCILGLPMLPLLAYLRGAGAVTA
jgi:septum formation protein